MELSAAKSEIGHSEAFGQNSAVVVDGVTFAFHNGDGAVSSVLRSITIRLEYGQIIGIAGRNAAGKTTLLNVIRGALVPQIGSVLVGGSPVSRNGELLRLPDVSLVSQRPEVSLGPSMTVYENFILATRGGALDFRPAYTRQLRGACESLVSRANIGLETKLDEQARFLSGGQQQALSVLLALRSPEHVLLMDEPTASLDPYAGMELLDLATREAEAERALVVIVSHRLRDLIERCQRIIVLNRGHLVYDLEPSDGRWSEQELFRLLMTEEAPVKNGTSRRQL